MICLSIYTTECTQTDITCGIDDKLIVESKEGEDDEQQSVPKSKEGLKKLITEVVIDISKKTKKAIAEGKYFINGM